MSEAATPNRPTAETKVTRFSTRPKPTKKNKKLWGECPYFDYDVKMTRAARNDLASRADTFYVGGRSIEDLARMICADFYVRSGGKPMTGTNAYMITKRDTGAAVCFEPQDGTVYVYMRSERSDYQDDPETNDHR